MVYSKFFKALCGIVFVMHTQLHSAGFVTHAFLALEWLKYNRPLYSEKQVVSFLKGTLFNDIRYLVPLPRAATHEKGLVVEDILAEENPFEAGRKFHSWVDEKRSRVIRPAARNNLIRVLESSLKLDEVYSVPSILQRDLGFYVFETYLKFLEDELLFERHDWSFLRKALLTFDHDELQWDIAPEILKQWHATLIEHFTYKPSELFSNLCSMKEAYWGLPGKLICVWGQHIPYRSRMPCVQDHLKNVLAYFDKQSRPLLT